MYSIEISRDFLKIPINLGVFNCDFFKVSKNLGVLENELNLKEFVIWWILEDFKVRPINTKGLGKSHLTPRNFERLCVFLSFPETAPSAPKTK